MSFSAFGALLKKNLKLKIRSKMSLFSEIMIPILLIGISISLVSQLELKKSFFTNTGNFLRKERINPTYVQPKYVLLAPQSKCKEEYFRSEEYKCFDNEAAIDDFAKQKEDNADFTGYEAFIFAADGKQVKYKHAPSKGLQSLSSRLAYALSFFLPGVRPH